MKKSLAFFAALQILLAQAPSPSETIALQPGRSIERELQGAQVHAYQLDLREGEYARVSVEQRGIDVFVAVSGPEGRDRFESGTDMMPNGREEVEIVASSTGPYRLEVKAEYKALPAGKYVIAVTEQRSASERDRLLQRARVLNTDSLRLRRTGKQKEAQTAAEEALELRERELGPNHPDTARSLHVLSKLGQDQGRYDWAQQLGERALRIREIVFGPDHPEVATALDNLGNILRLKEDFPAAIAVQQRALSILEQRLGPGHPAAAVVWINAGVTHRLQGDLAGAEQAYLHAISIQEKALGPQDYNVAVAASNLGLVYTERAEYAAATQMFLRAIDILEKTLGPEHAALRDPLMNLANVYSMSGQFEAAKAQYERVLKLIERSLSPTHPSAATLLVNFGSSLRYQGDLASAEVMYRRALGIREAAFGAEHPSVARVLDLLAIVLEARGEPGEALAAQKRSAKIAERELAANLAVGSERQRLAYFSMLPEQTSQIVSMGLRNGPALPEAFDLAATVLLERKGRVQEAFGDTLSSLRRHASPESISSLYELSSVAAEIAKAVLEGAPERSRAAYIKRLKALEDARENLEDSLSRQVPGLTRTARSVTPAMIQAALPPGAALVEYTVFQPPDLKATAYGRRLGPPRYAALVLRREGPPQWRDLGPAEAIDRAVAAWRDALRNPARQDVRSLARSVDEAVMRPLRRMTGDAAQLLISPDGALNLIPFAALVDEHRQYLVERYSLTYLTTGRDLLRTTNRNFASPAGRPLILADPDFGDPAPVARASTAARAAMPSTRSIRSSGERDSVYFAPLPGTAREAKAIASLYPESRLLAGAGATESAVKQASSPAILHVATHGFFLGGLPGSRARTQSMNPMLRSGLALAGANRRNPKGEDGILTALEASGLNLWGTRLVTLSSCDTGLGEIRNGEGVYGLRRALLLAGAESLVMSLWPVSDQVTRELMTAYYTRLKAGEGRGEALRQVQLAVLKRSALRHPFYWASFIHEGEWTALTGK